MKFFVRPIAVCEDGMGLLFSEVKEVKGVNASLEVKDNTQTNSKTIVDNFINFDNFERSDNYKII